MLNKNIIALFQLSSDYMKPDIVNYINKYCSLNYFHSINVLVKENSQIPNNSDFYKSLLNNKVFVHKGVSSHSFISNFIKNDKNGSDIAIISPYTDIEINHIDELKETLYSFDKHAISTPLTNSGLYSSYFNCLEKSSVLKTWSSVKKYLPRHDILTYCCPSIALLKRNLLNNFFNLIPSINDCDIFQLVNHYSDFIGKMGYNMILSNQSFAFNSNTETLNLYNNKGLLPGYKKILEYQSFYINPILKFAEEITGNPRKKILIDIYRINPIHNGTSEYTLTLLKHLYKPLKKKYDLTILINQKANDIFGVSKLYDNVIFKTNNLIGKKFDLTYTPFQIFDFNNLFYLHDVSPRFIVCILDIIALRCIQMRRSYHYELFNFIINYSDAITVPTNYVKEDIINFFNNKGEKIHRILLSRDKPLSNKEKELKANKLLSLPEKYIFLVGNSFPHKAIQTALRYIPKHISVVVLSSKNKVDGNVIYLESGKLPEYLIDYIYKKCSFILFPSQYEGFGLPVLASAVYGKNILLYDSSINREVTSEFGLNKNVYYFRYFEEIYKLSDILLNKLSKKEHFERTWEKVATDMMQVIDKTINKKIDTNKLIEKNHEINRLRVAFGQNNITNKFTASLRISRIKKLIERYIFPKYSLRRKAIRKIINK